MSLISETIEEELKKESREYTFLDLGIDKLKELLGLDNKSSKKLNKELRKW